jgi:SNF2 family DNA or RNA helicase
MDDGRWATGILNGRVAGTEMRISVVGPDWETDKIAKALKNMTVLPKKTRDGSGELSLPLTWAVVTQCARLAEEYEFRWAPGEDLSAWIFDEFTRRFSEYRETSDLKFDLAALERTPMAHQASGAYVGAVNKRFFFGDAAGTGKTFTALLTMAEMQARGLDPFPAFVVTPASVVDPWLEELGKCFPDWTYTAYRGANRKKLSSRYQVYVMSWDVFRRDMYPEPEAECPYGHGAIAWKPRDQKELDKHLAGQVSTPMVCVQCNAVMLPTDTDKKKIPPLIEFNVPRTLVLDEAHALCNTKTKQSIAAVRAARVAPYAFPMSGTPITNDVSGFWTAMRVLDIRSFPDSERYAERYCDRYSRDYGKAEVTGLTTVNREEFYTVLQGSMRSVAKRDVLDLPPKTYSTRVVTIPPAYRKAYDEMEEDMIAHIPDTDEPLPVMNTLAQMQRLAQLASSACDVEIEYVLDEKKDSLTFGEQVPHYKVTMREPCWKVDELMQVVEESGGEPIVTFSPYTQLIDLAGARAESKGLRVGYIKGGQTHNQRTATRLAFQAGEIDLLCANTSAGGVGLTLTRSHTVVFLQRPWAYWRADQSEDRLDRFGQREPVSVIDIVATNTIESRVREALKDKARNLSELVRDPRIVRNFLGGQQVRV